VPIYAWGIAMEDDMLAGQTDRRWVIRLEQKEINEAGQA